MVRYGQRFECQHQQQSAWHRGPCCCRCYVPPGPESDAAAAGAPWLTIGYNADWHFGTVRHCCAGIASKDLWVGKCGQHSMAEDVARVCETSSFQWHAFLNEHPHKFCMCRLHRMQTCHQSVANNVVTLTVQKYNKSQIIHSYNGCL